MRNEWKKTLGWLNDHKLVYVLVGILVLLALYCAFFRPILNQVLGIDEETMDSGITVSERVTGTFHVTPEEAESMECYLEYYRPDSIIGGEYTTGEWQSRVVYRDNGTTFYEEDNDWGETEEEVSSKEADEVNTESSLSNIADKTETTSTAGSIAATTAAATTAPTSTPSQTTVQESTSPTIASSAATTTSEQTTSSMKRDPFEDAGWTKTKEDSFFKYYKNDSWEICWCYKDYGGGDFDEVMMNEYLGTDTQVIVPGSIAGKKVTSMCDTFLDSKIHFSNITIPPSVREMYGTFGRAYYIGKITFEKGSKLAYVDDRAFGGTHCGGDDWDALTTIVCESTIEKVIVDGYYVNKSDFIFERLN